MSHTAIPDREERELPEFNAMQKVKRRFFAMRNGDLAAQMAVRGARYRINFGLNLPQIVEIARDFLPGGTEFDGLPEDFDMADFARRLRDNTTTRESRLIAPMLFPLEKLTAEEALEWARSADVPEVADVLCLKLLRHFPQAEETVERLLESGSTDINRYCGLRLMLNLVSAGIFDLGKASRLADQEVMRRCALTTGVSRQILEEVEFLSET